MNGTGETVKQSYNKFVILTCPSRSISEWYRWYSKAKLQQVRYSHLPSRSISEWYRWYSKAKLQQVRYSHLSQQVYQWMVQVFRRHWLRNKLILCTPDTTNSCQHISVNPIMGTLNRRKTNHYTAIQWLVHWPLMGGLLHLEQQGETWAGCGPAQSPACCTKCNRPSTTRVPTRYYSM